MAYRLRASARPAVVCSPWVSAPMACPGCTSRRIYKSESTGGRARASVHRRTDILIGHPARSTYTRTTPVRPRSSRMLTAGDLNQLTQTGSPVLALVHLRRPQLPRVQQPHGDLPPPDRLLGQPDLVARSELLGRQCWAKIGLLRPQMPSTCSTTGAWSAPLPVRWRCREIRPIGPSVAYRRTNRRT